MRAACLLVCLTLAHGIAGSIFNPQQLDTFLDEKLDLISQHMHHKRQQQVEEPLSQQKSQEDQQNQQSQDTIQPQSQEAVQQQQQQSQSQESWNNQKLQEDKQQQQQQQPQVSQEAQYQQNQQEDTQQINQQQSQDSQYPQNNRQQSQESQEPQYHQRHHNRHQQRDSQSQESQSNQKPQDYRKHNHHSQYQKYAQSQDQSEEVQHRHQSQRHERNRNHHHSHHNRNYQQSNDSPNQQQQVPLEQPTQQSQYKRHLYIQHPYHPHKNSKVYSKKSHSSSSASSSSSSESHESKERKYKDDSKPFHTNKKWNTIGTTVVTYDDMGDVVMWKDQMPVVPSHVNDKQDIDQIFDEARKAMKHITPEEKAMFHQKYEVATQDDKEYIPLNATELVKQHQYPVEEHIVKTEDGYLLTLFRIPPTTPTRDVQKRPVVFLMHGLLGSADDWLLMGPGKSLAYLLSDAGYDVWLGNARGNKYSKHVSKHPAVADFWQFSTDEIALQDLPAMIDYTLQTTAQEKLYYIGHALGTTAFFAMTAAMPKYNDKIIMMYALSPVVYMKNVRSPLFRMIAPTSKFQQALKNELGQGAFSPNKDLIRIVGGAMCEDEIGCKRVCSNVNFIMSGVNAEGLEPKVISKVLTHLPAGTSTKMIKHFGQGVASDDFKKYDYGPRINEQVYGTPEPPKYDMQKVHAPVTLFYSEEDWLAHPKDVQKLQNELPNVNEAVKVADQHFTHMDFQFSTKAPEAVYKQLIESMEKQLS